MSGEDAYEAWRRATMQEGERELLVRQLRRRFGAGIDSEIERRVVSASAEQFEIWVDRLFSATTLAELLAD